METKNLIFSAFLMAALAFGAIYTYRYYRLVEKVETRKQERQQLCVDIHFELILLRDSLNMDPTIAMSLPAMNSMIKDVIGYCKISAGQDGMAVAKQMLKLGLSLQPDHPRIFLDTAIQHLVDSGY